MRWLVKRGFVGSAQDQILQNLVYTHFLSLNVKFEHFWQRKKNVSRIVFWNVGTFVLMLISFSNIGAFELEYLHWTWEEGEGWEGEGFGKF